MHWRFKKRIYKFSWVDHERERYLKNLGETVSNPSTGQKKYWSALKKLLNKNITSVIPPILYEGTFITDAKEKCNIFNEYFRKQCQIIETSSTVTPLSVITDQSFSLSIVSRSRRMATANGLDILSPVCPVLGHPSDLIRGRVEVGVQEIGNIFMVE